MTGYWTLPAGDWRPDPALQEFIDSPGPVVSLGFGSMGSADPDALGALVRAAAQEAGVRVVLLTGRGEADETLFPAGALPHDWLFARMAANVHHGGAGTTGTALAAGRPGVVVPFAVDQPFWAARVAALGVGPTPIPRRSLTAARLAAALRRAVQDAPMRLRAARLAAALHREDGVAAAVGLLGRLG